MAKFLIRSLISLNLKWYDNINSGLVKKYVTCIMVFFIQFHFVKFSQFYFTTPSVLFTKLHLETIDWMKRRLFAYMLLENHIFNQNWIFRPLYMYKQPTLKKQWKYNIFVQILYSYFRYTGRLFLRCARFLARGNIIRASCETNKEVFSFKGNIQKNLCEGHKDFDCTHSFLCKSLLLSLSSPILFPSDVLAQWPVLVVFCDNIISEWSKIWKPLAILF